MKVASIRTLRCCALLVMALGGLTWPLPAAAQPVPAAAPAGPLDAKDLRAKLTYQDVADAIADLCDGETLRPSACPREGDRDALAKLCIRSASAAEVAIAWNASCLNRRVATRDPSDATRGGATSSRSVDWVGAATDFFVGRLQGELAYMLQKRVTRSLCGNDETRPVGKKLLPQSCQLLTASTGSPSLIGLPGALRADLRELPQHLVEFALDKVPAGSPAQAALCVVDAGVRVAPTMLGKGPIPALAWLESFKPAAPCLAGTSGVTMEHLRTAAKVLKLVLEKTADSAGTSISPQALTVLTKVILVQPPGPERIEAAAAALTRAAETFAELTSSKALDRQQLAQLLDALADALAALTAEGDQAADVTATLRAMSAFWAGHYAAALTELTSVDSLGKALEKTKLGWLWKGLQKFGPLIGGLAEARTTDEARAALEAAAVPLGSYRAFRQGGTAVFLSGYAGIGLSGESRTDVLDPAPVLSPMLPVGVELGWPRGDSGSWNVLFSVVDLGAVAATRLTKQGTKEMAEDNALQSSTRDDLAGVLAPGIFGSIGLGDTPFLLGAGLQYLPASRAVFDCPADGLCSSTRDQPVLRGSIFIAVDLPAFALSL